MTSSRVESRAPKVGVLTKTVVQSPVARWIIHARIRRRQYNDIVFVGDDFMHVKQVKELGHLEHIATKNDFDARIRAAKAFNNETQDPDEELFVKREYEEASTEETIPPQCLVLTLDTNDLLFICVVADDVGGYRFIHQACPMPTFDRILFQPGEHLAVDPDSRALAVAANEREVVIYSAKSKASITNQLRTRDRNWCPIAAQRPLQVDGVIQHMDFLIPRSDDDDHIILLLILIDQSKTKAAYIDWYLTSDLHSAQIHPALPLDNAGSAPNLLVPLRNASFLLINNEIKRWKNILSGSIVGETVDLSDTESYCPGASPKKPLWVNWCRPIRGQGARDDVDHLYLVREDGLVYLIQAGREIVSSHAGEFGCHVGSAFASLGDSLSPDILAVAGDMSSGRVHSIGNWGTPRHLAERSRLDTMEMDLVETIPNWATVTDMVTSSLPGKSQRSRDGIFVTSCRQPHGAITELRQGLEARVSIYFELEGLRNVTDVWALPLAAVGHILLVLSSPAGTRMIDVSADAAMEEIEEVDGSTLALDSGSQTLATAATIDANLIQITRKSVCVTPGASANFEDSAKIEFDDSSTILAAAIDIDQSYVVTAERSKSFSTGFALVYYALRRNDEIPSGEAQLQRKIPFDITYEPLCVEVLKSGTFGSVILCTSADGVLSALALGKYGISEILTQTRISSSSQDLCDNIAIIRSTKPDGRYLVVCGLRDGKLRATMVDEGDDFSFQDDYVVDFSQSAVKLTQQADDRSVAYAMSSSDMCLLSWDGQSVSSLNIQSIWTSDKNRPELAQGSVVACTRMPAAHLLSSPDLAESLIMVSGDEFLVTTLDRRPGPVPRQIPVNGTPNRLLYAEQQRCIVCASLRYDVRTFPSSSSHSRTKERRQIFPVIDFVPARSSQASFTYEMQSGERIYALLEWSFKLSEDKTYSFILVGGSYFKSSGSQRGRITFLQPVNKNWTVVDVKEGRKMTFGAPVFAMALLDELTYVACVGRNVMVYRFSVDDRKWEQLCEPFQLSSPGLHLSTHNPFIYVSTAKDSLFTLIFRYHGDDEEPSRSYFRYYLLDDTVPPRADTPLTHIRPIDDDLTLVSTKHGQLIGLGPPSNTSNLTKSRSNEMLFEAELPRSLTRMRQCNTKPRWKAGPPDGVRHCNIVGCAADGTLMGVAVLEEHIWRRLSWLQKLCEWSEEISRHSYQSPLYSVSEQTYARNERGLPIGLGRGGETDIVMVTSRSKFNDGHIDGDVLVRVLQKGGAEMLKKVVREQARRDDRAGEWIKEHLGEELEAVDDIIEVLETVLDCWI